MTGANGLPVAISARPSVQAIRSAGFASARAGGVESAKMIGRSVCAAMSLTIASVKLPDAVDAPISMVGFTRRTTSARPMPVPFALVLPALAFGGRAGVGRLIVAQTVRPCRW